MVHFRVEARHGSGIGKGVDAHDVHDGPAHGGRILAFLAFVQNGEIWLGFGLFESRAGFFKACKAVDGAASFRKDIQGGLAFFLHGADVVEFHVCSFFSCPSGTKRALGRKLGARNIAKG